MDPHIQVSPNKPAYFLDGSYVLVHHLHGVVKVVDVGYYVLVLQATILNFWFPSVINSSLVISCVSTVTSPAELESSDPSLTSTSSGGRCARACCFLGNVYCSIPVVRPGITIDHTCVANGLAHFILFPLEPLSCIGRTNSGPTSSEYHLFTRLAHYFALNYF